MSTTRGPLTYVAAGKECPPRGGNDEPVDRLSYIHGLALSRTAQDLAAATFACRLSGD